MINRGARLGAFCCVGEMDLPFRVNFSSQIFRNVRFVEIRAKDRIPEKRLANERGEVA